MDLSLKLTTDQRRAFKSFSSWLEQTNKNIPFVLSGYAGSGKTFLSIKFLKLVESKNICWTLVAPTHKAVDVLRKALDLENLKPVWHPSTIHRLLRLRLKRKGDMEICEETDQTANSLEQLGLVLVDESSMIEGNLLEIVLRSAHQFGTRLVFVGDPAQLPPVGEVTSPVFSMKRSNIVKLTQVVRHKGMVLNLATSIRDGSLPCIQPPCLLQKKSQSIVGSLDSSDWLKKAQAALRSAAERQQPDSARILCYTNRMLERLVPHARRAIHGEMADQLPFLPGEVLISRKAVMASASLNGGDLGEDPNMLIGSNREMVVIDVKSEKFHLSDFELDSSIALEFPMVEILIAKVSCGDFDFSLRVLPRLGSTSRNILENLLNKISSLAKQAIGDNRVDLWRNFFLLKDSFASLGPASVLTVHRSQGSTFGEVFIASDVFWPKDPYLKKQLVYVAISRASNQVWIEGTQKNNSKNQAWKEYFV